MLPYSCPVHKGGFVTIMSAEVKLTEHDATLGDENSYRVKGADRVLSIVKRLDAISVSVSFHYDFLQYFAEITEDDSEDEITDEKPDTIQDKDTQENVEPSKIKDIDLTNAGEAEDSIDGISECHDENDLDDVPSDSPDNRDHDCLASDQPDAQSETGETTGNTEKDDNCQNGTTGGPKKKKLNVQYCYRVNLLTTEFIADCKLSEAKKTTKSVLRVMPDNFNALWNKVKLMIAMAEESGDCIDEAAEDILNQLEQTVSQNGRQILIAKAEIVGMYLDVQVTTDSLIRSIRLYEEILAKKSLTNQNECVDPLPENLVDFWKYELVKSYAKLTNANKELLTSYGFHHGEVLSRLEDLVLAVDSSDHIANKLKAQTWVNLANTFEHYRQNYRMERFRQDIYYGQLTLADCFANASALDPDNVRILMRAGRELRQRSRSEQDLHEALRMFKKVLKADDIDDIRDIIYHHMGLTYRSLWQLTESPIHDCATDDAYHSTRASRSVLPLGCRVIKPPHHPLDFDLIPPPYKTPPKAAYWKILNPIARNPENPYLLKSRKCFQEASNLVKDTLYSMEIARTYLCARDVDKARECLLKAEEQPSSDITSVDFVGTSLYESLGLLEENEMMRKEFNDADAEKIKSYYKESIRFSTISKNKPIVTFHYHLRVLYKQLERNIDQHFSELDQMIIQNEYFLLYMAIQQSEDNYKIVNSVASDDFRVALLWSLIDMFNRRNQQYDASAAFTHLSILVMAKKLTTEVKGVTLTSTEKQRILIHTAERVTLQRVDQPRFLPEPYRELHALREDEIVEETPGDILQTLTDKERKKLDIVMKIIDPGFSPGYTRLTEQCYRT